MPRLRPRTFLWIVPALAALVVAVALLQPFRSRAEGDGVRVGDAPPPLPAQRIAGPDDPSLDAHRGHVVVLAFVSTRCRACHRALAELRDLERSHRAQGLRVVALVSEPVDRVRAFAEQAALSFTFATVPPEAAARYGVQYIPDLFVVDRAGKLQARVTGSDDPDLTRLRDAVARLLAAR